MAISEGLALTRQLLSLMESTPALTAIDFSCGDVQIRLSGHPTSTHEIVTSPPGTVPPSPAAPAKPATSPDVTVITAALHGVFYHSPSPGAAPFVAIGEWFSEGQQLGIIEAMKMLNVVEADQKGKIVRVLIKDAEVVTPGTPLFEIEVA